MAPTTMGELFARSFETWPDRAALRVRRGERWEVITFGELGTHVRALGEALLSLGVAHGDRVAIFAANRPEWTIADVAALSIGAVVVPIYQTSTPSQAAHILADSGASVIFVGSEEYAVVAEVDERLPELHAIVSLDQPVAALGHAAGYTFDELLARAQPGMAAAGAAAYAERAAAVRPDDLATLIYTSGTTGEPKGVMLTHAAFAYEREAVLDFFPITPEDTSVCFLPLSHALERAWTFVVLTCGVQNTYVENPREVAEVLPLAKPSLLVSVPRLFETVFKTAHERAAASPIKKRLFDWAIATGYRAQHDRLTPVLRAKLAVADTLVLAGIRNAVGGRKTAFACGGAALRKEVEEFFLAAGMLVCQGYGLTEAAPLISFNSPRAFRFGTVGHPIHTSEVRIGEDGEICYRGPNVMTGYWNDPESTASALTADGWLRTGDVGHLDEDGFLSITDRLKDLIVTQGGKNIAPAPLEGELAADALIEHAVVIGDNRPCLTALIRPAEGAGNVEGIVEQIKERVHQISSHHPGYERIREVAVITDELTMENGLLTPTLKIRRRAVEQAFADEIEQMYHKVAHRR